MVNLPGKSLMIFTNPLDALPLGIRQQLLAMGEVGILTDQDICDISVAMRKHLDNTGNPVNLALSNEKAPPLLQQRGI